MKRLLLWTAFVSLLGQSAFAQMMELRSQADEVVSVGTRIGTVNPDELTSPVSVLTEADIAARGQTYVTDILRSLAGVSVNSSGPAGNLTQVRVRGSEANHVLVLVDGVDVSNPNAGGYDFAGLSARDVIRIEVLRGEQSALWGSDAIGGVINIITKSGASKESFTASLEGGSRNTMNGQVSAIVPLKSAALSVNGNLFTTNGYDISGSGGEKDGSKSRNLNVGLNNVRLGGVALSAKVSTSNLEAEFDSGFPVPVDTNDELFTDLQTGRVDARFNLAGFDNLVTFSGSKTDTDNPNSGFRNTTAGERMTANWAAKKTWGYNTLTLLAETEDENFSNFGGAGAGQNQSRSIRNHALAADYRYSDGEITLTGSARQDFNDRFKDEMTWRFGGGYTLKSLGGRARISVGTGVKNPTLTELFGFFPGDFLGNENLVPERSIGYNIGYQQDVFDGRLSVSVDYFHSNLENEVYTVFGSFDPVTFMRLSPDTVENQIENSTRKGLEIQGRWTLSSKLSAQGSMTFVDADENGTKEIRRPDFLASATLTWAPMDKLSLTASIDHTGNQIDSDFAAFPARPVDLDAFTLVGLNAAYDVNDIMTLTFRGDNLLDETYQEVLGYASQGRGIYAGMRATFD